MPTETYDTQGDYTFDASEIQEGELTVEGAGGGGAGGSTNISADSGGSGGNGGLADGTIDLSGIDTLQIQIGGGGGGGGATGGGGGSGGAPGGGSGEPAPGSDVGGGGGGGGATLIQDGTGTVLVVSDAGGGGSATSGIDDGGAGGGGERGGSGFEDGAGTGLGGDGGAGGTDDGQDGGAGGAEIISAEISGTTTSGGGNAGGAGGNNSGDFETGGDAGSDGSVVLDYNIPPDAPTNLSATTQTDSILLEWTANDPDAPTRLFRSTSAGVDTTDTQVAEVASGVESYEDTTAEQGVQYYYVAFAYDSGTDSYSAASNEVSPLIPLPAPTDLTATDIRSDEVDLSWNATHTNGETRVDVREDDSGDWTANTTVAFDTETATAIGLLNGQFYGLRVVAATDDTETVDQ